MKLISLNFMKILPFLLFICFSSFGQQLPEFFPIKSIDPASSTEDFDQFDSIFDSIRIVGIGESTHGTSEFTTMRHRIFKYLVEEKGYNTFFLEADYSACQRVNRYIQGNDDNALEALLEVRLWPWITNELLTMINWMKEYNTIAAEKIQFVGCDMQLIGDDQKEVHRFMKTEKDQQFAHEVLDSLKYGMDSTEAQLKYNQWMELFRTMDVKQFSDEDINQFALTHLSLTQWFEFQLTTRNKSCFRDSCMAANIVYYLEMFPDAKGMYFAHNGHVAKSLFEFKYIPNRKTAGRYLSETIGSDYIAIGQVFNSGSFNAFTTVDQQYQMTVFEIEKAKRKSLEKKLVKLDTPILLIPESEVKRKKRLYYIEIGAVHGKSKSGYKYRALSNLEPGRYDYFLFINSTNPTTLLKRPRI